MEDKTAKALEAFDRLTDALSFYEDFISDLRDIPTKISETLKLSNKIKEIGDQFDLMCE